MSTTKQAVLEMIERMPDDASIDEIMYALYFRQHVDEGLREAEDESVLIPQEQIEREMTEWVQSLGLRALGETSAG
jgi:hypothetical protein